MGLADDIRMPFGLTFAGAAYSDAALVRLATMFEALRPRRTSPPRTPELYNKKLGSARTAKKAAAQAIRN